MILSAFFLLLLVSPTHPFAGLHISARRSARWSGAGTCRMSSNTPTDKALSGIATTPTGERGDNVILRGCSSFLAAAVLLVSQSGLRADAASPTPATAAPKSAVTPLANAANDAATTTAGAAAGTGRETILPHTTLKDIDWSSLIKLPDDDSGLLTTTVRTITDAARTSTSGGSGSPLLSLSKVTSELSSLSHSIENVDMNAVKRSLFVFPDNLGFLWSVFIAVIYVDLKMNGQVYEKLYNEQLEFVGNATLKMEEYSMQKEEDAARYSALKNDSEVYLSEVDHLSRQFEEKSHEVLKLNETLNNLIADLDVELVDELKNQILYLQGQLKEIKKASIAAAAEKETDAALKKDLKNAQIKLTSMSEKMAAMMERDEEVLAGLKVFLVKEGYLPKGVANLLLMSTATETIAELVRTGAVQAKAREAEIAAAFAAKEAKEVAWIDERSELTRKLSLYETEMAKAKNASRSLESELAHSTTQMKGMAKRLEEYDRKLALVQKTLEQVQQENVQLSNAISSYQADLAAGKFDENNKKKADAVSATAATTTATAATMEPTIDGTADVSEEIKGKVSGKVKAKAKRIILVKRKDKTMDADTDTTDIDSSDAPIISAEEVEKQIANQRQELTAKVSTLTAENSELRRSIDELQAQITALESKTALSNAQEKEAFTSKKAKTATAAASSSLSSSSAAADEQEMADSKLEAAKAMAKELNTRLREKDSQHQKALSSISEMLKTAEADNEGLEKEVETLKEKLSSLTRSRSPSSSSSSSLSSRISASSFSTGKFADEEEWGGENWANEKEWEEIEEDVETEREEREEGIAYGGGKKTRRGKQLAMLDGEEGGDVDSEQSVSRRTRLTKSKVATSPEMVPTISAKSSDAVAAKKSELKDLTKSEVRMMSKQELQDALLALGVDSAGGKDVTKALKKDMIPVLQQIISS